MEIRISDYPQLRFISWSRCDDATVSGEEALSIYERNWRWVDAAKLTVEEKALIETLVQKYGNGVFFPDD